MKTVLAILGGTILFVAVCAWFHFTFILEKPLPAPSLPSLAPEVDMVPREVMELLRQGGMRFETRSDGAGHLIYQSNALGQIRMRECKEMVDWKPRPSAASASRQARELGPEKAYAWKQFLFEGDPAMLAQIRAILR